MNIEETYNIHKKLNCIFLKLKLKFLCKKGIHNYRIHPLDSRTTKWNWKCYCCGKEIESTD